MKKHINTKLIGICIQQNLSGAIIWCGSVLSLNGAQNKYLLFLGYNLQMKTTSPFCSKFNYN